MPQSTPAGFDILINGVQRTFRDNKEAAYDAARVLKRRNKNEIITIRDTATGADVMMREDGRMD